MEYIKNLKEYGFNTVNNVFIIAELGINHGGNIDTAKKLIDSAVKAGVDAVKFQTYITEKRVPKDSPIFNILKKCELPFEVFKELKDYASEKNVNFFSTPFDSESVDFLNNIGCDLYKIASFDVVNKELLAQIAKKGKPIIMSVGMSSLEEIKIAYSLLSESTSNIALLHCISAYPTEEKNAHLSVIYQLKQEFDTIIGQSDHTNDIIVPLYAAAAGAQILEKHFKIDDRMDCVDASVSITESQMSNLICEVRRIEKIFGENQFGLRDAEKGTELFRRFS